MAMNPYQGDDIDPFSGARDKEGSTNTRPTYKASTADQMDERDRREMEMTKTSGAGLKSKPKKSSIVTKEQLKASGFDNLRDYMNAQKGLTRRGDKGGSAVKRAADIFADKAADKAFGRSAIKTLEGRKGVSGASKAALPTGVSFPEDNPRLRRERAEKEAARDRDMDMGMKKGGKVKGYSKGGSVSKRADGCAQRGKTKGKVV